MKNIVKIIIITFLIVGFTSCSESYFDVNTPSGTAQPEQLRMSDLLAPVIYRTMLGQYSAGQIFGNYTQYFVGQGGTAAGETTADGLWTNIYLYALPNLMTIKEKAGEEGAIHYAAVADILTAINLGIATDTWDNIPYSEASKGIDGLLFPSFDSQESVYTTIFALLDGAIANLKAADPSGIEPGREDLIYHGDLNKWLRAAYTLKARYQLHLVNKGVTSANDVLTSIADGFTSNGDDFQMAFEEKNINPLYSQEVLARNTGNFHNDIASQFVSSMNGDYYPFEKEFTDEIFSIENNILPFDPVNNDTTFVKTIDPRLPIHAANGGDYEWKGFVSGGSGDSPDGTPGNVQFLGDVEENVFGYYTSIDSPILLISYAEALFIKAEAAFLANGGTTTSVGTNATAYMAYMDGIEASMDKFGADGTDYMNDSAIDVGVGSLMLHHIMKEKYIHNFMNTETFVDFRRYNFSSQVFTGLTIREEGDSSGEYVGQWFTRATYPSTELTRNRAVTEANQKTPVTPVWWQQ